MAIIAWIVKPSSARMNNVRRIGVSRTHPGPFRPSASKIAAYFSPTRSAARMWGVTGTPGALPARAAARNALSTNGGADLPAPPPAPRRMKHAGPSGTLSGSPAENLTFAR